MTENAKEASPFTLTEAIQAGIEWSGKVKEKEGIKCQSMYTPEKGWRKEEVE